MTPLASYLAVLLLGAALWALALEVRHGTPDRDDIVDGAAAPVSRVR